MIHAKHANSTVMPPYQQILVLCSYYFDFLILHGQSNNTCIIGLTVTLKQVLYDHLGVQILLRPWPDWSEWLPQP